MQVTYKSLSKELQIHVNVAKQILWKFYEKYCKKHNIECTYLLIGTLKDSGMCVEVVREAALSKAKKRFSEIISEHLYSVHKPLENLELLASSGSGDANYSAIKCDACTERSDEEMHFLRWGTTFKEAAEENVANLKCLEPENHLKVDKKLTTKKTGFNNLFNITDKQKNLEASKSIEIKKNKESVEKIIDFSKDTNFTENDKISMEKSKSLIGKNEDFTKSSKIKKTSPKAEMVKKAKKGGLESFFEKAVSPQKFVDIKMSKEKCNKVTKEPSEQKQAKEKEKIRGKKRNRSQENNSMAKRRKRIVMQSDSSDSEVQSDMEIEETAAEINDEAPVKSKSPSPPKVKHENGKRKVLKLMNKTYKKGEYMVTKKEHVYVSCSEDEEEEIRKEPSKMTTNAEKTKKKQTRLTNFFKKS